MNFDAKLVSELNVSLTADQALEWSGEQVIASGTWPLGVVGPAPATLSLRVIAKCDVHATGRAVAKAGVKGVLSASAGVAYDAGEGVKTMGKGIQFEPGRVSPQIAVEGDATVAVPLTPEVSVFLFDALGPTLSPSLLSRLEATSPPYAAKLVGGLSADVAFNLQFFGRQLAHVDNHVGTNRKGALDLGSGRDRRRLISPFSVVPSRSRPRRPFGSAK